MWFCHITYLSPLAKGLCFCVSVSYLSLIRSPPSCLAGHSEKRKKTRWKKAEAERQYQGMDRLGGRQVPEGSGRQGKTEKTGIPSCPNDQMEWLNEFWGNQNLAGFNYGRVKPMTLKLILVTS